MVKSKFKLILLLGIIVIILALLILPKHKKIDNNSKTTNEILLSKTDTVTSGLQTVSQVIPFTGDLSPLMQIVISAQLDAEVKSVSVSEGQLVKKGQVLAVLDNTDLVQALSEQEALLVSAQTKFNLDKQKLDRQKELYEQGFISKMGYDELIANYQVSQEVIHQQQASLQRIKKQLADTVVKAPFDGYIYQKNIDVGQLASKNSKLFALANLDNMQIKAPIPSDKISNIKINQPVQFRVETSKQTYTGKVIRINPVAEAGTRSYMVYINFDNQQNKLKSGQFVKGEIVLRSLANVVTIPTNSIHYTENSSYVLVIEQGVVHTKPITVLITNDLLNLAGVSGIESGKIVILNNVISIKVKDKVKLIQ